MWRYYNFPQFAFCSLFVSSRLCSSCHSEFVTCLLPEFPPPLIFFASFGLAVTNVRLFGSSPELTSSTNEQISILTAGLLATNAFAGRHNSDPRHKHDRQRGTVVLIRGKHGMPWGGWFNRASYNRAIPHLTAATIGTGPGKPNLSPVQTSIPVSLASIQGPVASFQGQNGPSQGPAASSQAPEAQSPQLSTQSSTDEWPVMSGCQESV